MCQCGNRTATRTCTDTASDFKRLHMAAIMTNIQSSSSSSMDLSELMSSGSTKKAKNNRTLECNDECAHIERNKRLALALQIENPERESKLSAPKYSTFLQDFARQDFPLAMKVHDELTKLVKLAKEVKIFKYISSVRCYFSASFKLIAL